jgi:hypothetical protein
LYVSLKGNKFVEKVFKSIVGVHESVYSKWGLNVCAVFCYTCALAKKLTLVILCYKSNFSVHVHFLLFDEVLSCAAKTFSSVKWLKKFGDREGQLINSPFSFSFLQICLLTLLSTKSDWSLMKSRLIPSLTLFTFCHLQRNRQN